MLTVPWENLEMSCLGTQKNYTYSQHFGHLRMSSATATHWQRRLSSRWFHDFLGFIKFVFISLFKYFIVFNYVCLCVGMGT